VIVSFVSWFSAVLLVQGIVQVLGTSMGGNASWIGRWSTDFTSSEPWFQFLRTGEI